MEGGIKRGGGGKDRREGRRKREREREKEREGEVDELSFQKSISAQKIEAEGSEKMRNETRERGGEREA